VRQPPAEGIGGRRLPATGARTVSGAVVGPGPAAEAVDAALGAVSLVAAVARPVVAAGVRLPRAVLTRLPVPPFARALAQRSLQAVGSQGAASRSAATEQLRHLADALVPLVVEAVLARLDVAGLVREHVDLDRIAAGLDVDAVMDRVDLDEIAARLDLDAIVDRVDLDRAVDRVDLDRAVDRVDLDSVVDRADLDRIVDRVDLDRAAGRLDLDSIIERIDVLGLARYVVEGIDLADLIRASTASVTSEVVRGVRGQGADADEAVERIIDRILRRHRARSTAVPGPAGDGVGRPHGTVAGSGPS
jgi:hypothetical protein